MNVLVVSGIWPPDVGGPASHAPEVAECRLAGPLNPQRLDGTSQSAQRLERRAVARASPLYCSGGGSKAISIQS